jgi:hypothetical protein
MDAIHPELIALDQWVLWRYEWRKAKWTKPPYQGNGRKADSTNPKTWASATEAQQGYSTGKFAGVGFVTAEDDPYILIDLDHVLNDDGKLTDWAAPIVDAAKRERAYIDRSPGGDGIHIIGRGQQLAAGKKKNGAEIYSSGRYLTVTGDVVSSPDGPLGILDQTATLVLHHINWNERNLDDELLDRARDAKNGEKFKALFDRGEIKGYQSASEADAALALLLAFWTRKDPVAMERLMRRSRLTREKWDSQYLTRTLTSAIERCSEVYGAPAGDVPATDISDFYAYLPEHRYIYVPTRDLWPGVSVDARHGPIDKLKASAWLDQNQFVDQMTWHPGEPLIVKDRVVQQGGWVQKVGGSVFNQYRPPQLEPGDPSLAGRWIEHVRRVFPSAADHILKWLAQRVQHPGQKINHALVLGGEQGIGKDTILEPVKYAIGPWNFEEVQPQQLLGRFNSFIKSVILRLSEAHDLGDSDRYKLYEHTKIFCAAPPDVLRCDEKNVREYAVFNVTGVILTTNYKTNGIYLPPDDRRHFVAWSDLTKNEFPENYWNDIYRWFQGGGSAHVAAYLMQLNIKDFDPKAPPPKTEAFYAIVDANRAPEDAELADILDRLNTPPTVTLDRLVAALDINSRKDFVEWITDRKNRRQIPHRMEAAGYTPIRNPSAKDGLWVINGVRQVVYGRRDLSESERQAAIQGRGP